MHCQFFVFFFDFFGGNAEDNGGNAAEDNGGNAEDNGGNGEHGGNSAAGANIEW